MELTSYQEFNKLSQEANLIPIKARINADTETPISAFLKMCSGPYRFLLESLENAETWGRYSFLGAEPSLVLKAKDQNIEIFKDGKTETHHGDCFEMIRRLLAPYHMPAIKGLPRFAGGFVGYLGYDTVRLIEKLPDLQKPRLPFYDAQLMLQDHVIAFDNLYHEVEILVLVHLSKKLSTKKAYQLGVERLEHLVKRLQKPLSTQKQKSKPAPLQIQSNTSKKKFFEMIEKSKAYIQAGDIFQVVPSQRWETPFTGDPFEVYRQLRHINPSPYLFYLQFAGQALAGSSPEVMVSLEDNKIQVRPIAGTRRRGRNPQDEAKMEKEMLNDPKEVAEHIMLVDLGRNDIGRVAKTGTVRVTEKMKVEKYSHVMHIVSNVEGQIKPRKDAIDVLRATFPAGTLSGAPKIRAMEIIEELEVGRRGPYGGAVGFIDYRGNMNTGITIRTLAFAQGKAWFQAGGGTVLDSKPELEYLESQNKARAMLEALKRCS